PTTPHSHAYHTHVHYLYQCPLHPRDPHPFPTRRSSDLDRGQAGEDEEGRERRQQRDGDRHRPEKASCTLAPWACRHPSVQEAFRSEEHTSELQSLTNLVCRLLLENKKVSKRYSSSSS